MNEKDIKALRWSDTCKDRQIPLGNCLYLHLRKSSKTYIIRKRDQGKQKIITIGKHSELPDKGISLRQARAIAADHAIKKDISNYDVGDLISKFWKEEVETKSKVPNQVKGYLDKIEDKFGTKRLSDVTRADCVSYIQYYSTNHGARSADRVRSYLKVLFSYGVELGWLESSPMLEVTKRITGYQHIERKRVLSPVEIRMVWSWKNPKTGWQKTEDNVRVIKFLLLTGLRISEAQNGYIDGDKFRMDDTKGRHSKAEKRPHWVYLTETAKSLLPLPECTPTNIQAWLKRRLEGEGYTDNRFTPHDCRRTFATLANESGILPHVVEKCLNHKMEGMLAVYNHAEYEEDRIEAAKLIERRILEVICE